MLMFLSLFPPPTLSERQWREKSIYLSKKKWGEGCDVGGTGPGSALIVTRKDREAGFTEAKPQLRFPHSCPSKWRALAGSLLRRTVRGRVKAGDTGGLLSK